MPHKLKTSARRSRRNKKIAIAAGVTILALIVVAAVYVFVQPKPATQLVVQGKVLFQTSMGNMTIQLRDDKPITSSNFKNLVERGKYDNTTFYRVIKGFMIQGGHTNENFSKIPDEIGTNNSNVEGSIAMANGGPNTASTEFFINVANNNNITYPDGTTFDGTYTVFGKVIDGMDVALAISHVPVDDPKAQSPKPLQEVTLIKAVVLP